MTTKPTPTLRKVLAASLTLTTIVTAGWVGDGLKGECLFEPWLGACGESHLSLLCRVLAAGVLFGLSLYGLYRITKGLLPFRHLAQTPSVAGHRVLIAALSPFTPQPRVEADNSVVIEDGDKRVVLTGNLDTDIGAFTTMSWRWNGQQFLRALRPHVQARTLEHLVLLGSPGPRGSFDSLAAAEQLARLYAPSVAAQHHPVAIGPEDIESLQQAFNMWIERFRKQGIAEKDIILDVTGGQKTTSIAAALTTLHSDRIEFQYVQTEPKKPGEEIHVIGFNVVIDTAQKGTDA